MHFQADTGTSKANGIPLNLFLWANAMQAGIVGSGTVGGKKLDMTMNMGLQALANESERMVICLQQVTDNTAFEANLWNLPVEGMKRRLPGLS